MGRQGTDGFSSLGGHTECTRMCLCVVRSWGLYPHALLTPHALPHSPHKLSLLQVKVWNTLSGFCFITFTEHSSGVTGVTFTATGYVIVTSSMDGTVRAFDLHR